MHTPPPLTPDEQRQLAAFARALNHARLRRRALIALGVSAAAAAVLWPWLQVLAWAEDSGWHERRSGVGRRRMRG